MGMPVVPDTCQQAEPIDRSSAPSMHPSIEQATNPSMCCRLSCVCWPRDPHHSGLSNWAIIQSSEPLHWVRTTPRVPSEKGLHLAPTSKSSQGLNIRWSSLPSISFCQQQQQGVIQATECPPAGSEQPLCQGPTLCTCFLVQQTSWERRLATRKILPLLQQGSKSRMVCVQTDVSTCGSSRSPAVQRRNANLDQQQQRHHHSNSNATPPSQPLVSNEWPHHVNTIRRSSSNSRQELQLQRIAHRAWSTGPRGAWNQCQKCLERSLVSPFWTCMCMQLLAAWHTRLNWFTFSIFPGATHPIGMLWCPTDASCFLQQNEMRFMLVIHLLEEIVLFDSTCEKINQNDRVWSLKSQKTLQNNCVMFCNTHVAFGPLFCDDNAHSPDSKQFGSTVMCTVCQNFCLLHLRDHIFWHKGKWLGKKTIINNEPRSVVQKPSAQNHSGSETQARWKHSTQHVCHSLSDHRISDIATLLAPPHWTTAS